MRFAALGALWGSGVVWPLAGADEGPLRPEGTPAQDGQLPDEGEPKH
jgi:hypothetical protein